ncbi:MAG: hypothetical protein HQK54_13990 [Oligoflexales bacterium]|nr:hypothetical protein [Oligoflexales bacterium]
MNQLSSGKKRKIARILFFSAFWISGLICGFILFLLIANQMHRFHNGMMTGGQPMPPHLMMDGPGGGGPRHFFEGGHRGGRRWGNNPSWDLPPDFKEIHLDDRQKNAIKEIITSSRDAFEKLFADVSEARRKFEVSLHDGKDPDIVRENFRLMVAAKDKVELEHLETIIRVHSVLTPEQLSKLKGLRQHHGRGRLEPGK